MDKDKFILLAQKRLWEDNGTIETALHNQAIQELIEYAQADSKEINNLKEDLKAEILYSEYWKENSRKSLKLTQDLMQTIRNKEPYTEGLKLQRHSDNLGISLDEEKTNFDVITESPEKLSEFILEQYGYSPIKDYGKYFNLGQWLKEKAGE